MTESSGDAKASPLSRATDGPAEPSLGGAGHGHLGQMLPIPFCPFAFSWCLHHGPRAFPDLQSPLPTSLRRCGSSEPSMFNPTWKSTSQRPWTNAHTTHQPMHTNYAPKEHHLTLAAVPREEGRASQGTHPWGGTLKCFLERLLGARKFYTFLVRLQFH